MHGQIAGMWSAESHWHTETLRGAEGDIGTDLTGRGDQGQRKQVGAEVLARLAALPFEARLQTPAGELLVVHSSPRGTSDRRGGPHNSAAEMMEGYGGTGANAIAFGHYHSSFVRPMPWGLLINIASVGLPIRRDTLAAYTVLTATGDGWVVEQRHVGYDPEEESRAAAAAGMPPWEAEPSP